MRAFKGKQFSRWAAGEAISDADLCRAAAEAFDGQYDADLGGYLFKKRIARQDGGEIRRLPDDIGVQEVRFKADILPLWLSQECPVKHYDQRAECAQRKRFGIGGHDRQAD